MYVVLFLCYNFCRMKCDSMSNKVCPNCGLQYAMGSKFCMSCGSALPAEEQEVAVTPISQPTIQPVSNGPVVPIPVNAAQAPVTGEFGSLLIRRKTCYQGWALPLTVLVDGNQYTFNNGDELTFHLTPGVHWVVWKFWCRSDQQTQVTVVPGGYYFVELVYDWVWGGFKMNPESKVG